MKSYSLSPNPSSPKSALSRTNNRSLSPSPTNSSELQQIFNHFDENGDGTISPIELHNCVRNLGGELSIEDAEAAVRAFDGVLGFEDFRKLIEGNSSEEEKTEELRLAFRMYEAEPGSGFITPTSLKRMLSRLGDSRSLDECNAMIRSFDLNGDGVLCFNEFAIMMR